MTTSQQISRTNPAAYLCAYCPLGRRYSCDHCQFKQDAIRYTRLDALPPVSSQLCRRARFPQCSLLDSPQVLHFSLARFAFDWDTNRRVKVQSMISYPLLLDMAKFLDPPAGSTEHPTVLYQLKGVLMHKGKSATHGHYVAQVHDVENDKWFLFDDELVSPIDDLNAPSQYDQDDEPIKNKKDKSTALPRDADGNVRPKSKDAYMLVYTKVETDSPQPTSTQPKLPVEPPPLALAQVEATDQAQAKEVDEWDAKAAKVKDQFEAAREEKRSVYNQFRLNSDETSGYLVTQASLASWIKQGLDKKDKLTTTTDLIDLTGDDSDLLKVASAIDGQIAAVEGHSNRAGSTAERDRPSVTPTLAGTSDPDELNSAADSEPTAEPVVLRSSSIKCKHGKVDVERVAEMKLISKVSLASTSLLPLRPTADLFCVALSVLLLRSRLWVD